MSDTPRDGKQILGDRVRNLEDEFFRQEDERLMQRLRELKQREASREALAKASGITNQAILDALLEPRHPPGGPGGPFGRSARRGRVG